jgi:phosphate starvation-inducible PhoH-like protein
VNSYLDSTQVVRSHDVGLPQRYIEHLFSGSNAPGRHIEQAVRPFRLQITHQDGGLRFAGDAVAVTLGEEMMVRLSAAQPTTSDPGEALIRDIAAAVIQDALKHDLPYRLAGVRQALRPMSLSQVAFMNAVLPANRSLIFGVGATGTGKTHLAIAAGLSLVAESRFKCLVITRPHVMMEGEIMTPALRAETAYDEQLTPIDDALHELVGIAETRRLIEQGLVEIIPLGRMRGRTFQQSFIVVDEAQNMTVRKMRMAITRLGRASCMVVTGDPTQNDLRGDEASGLTHLLHLIAGTDLALVHQFQNHEIIRTELVARIETLYAQEDRAGMRAA